MKPSLRPYSLADLKVPGLSREAVAALEKLIPERCPGINDNNREIWMYAGKRELVNFLKHQMEVNECVVRDA